MRTYCPGCATEVIIAIDGDLPGFPIRVEWNSEIPGRHVGVAVVDSHEPASELYHSTEPNTCEITVVHYPKFLGSHDMYGEQICIVHVCDSGGEAGDRTRLLRPPPSRPATR